MSKPTYIESTECTDHRAKVPTPVLQFAPFLSSVRCVIDHCDQEIRYWREKWQELADAIESSE